MQSTTDRLVMIQISVTKFKHADNSSIFLIAYTIQTSSIWNYTLFAFSMIYMYLIVAEPNNRLDTSVPINIPAVVIGHVILCAMILDCIFEIIHKNSWKGSFSKKYPFRFWAKIIIVSLLIVDDIVFHVLFKTYPLRPFRILRSCTYSPIFSHAILL